MYKRDGSWNPVWNNARWRCCIPNVILELASAREKLGRQNRGNGNVRFILGVMNSGGHLVAVGSSRRICVFLVLCESLSPAKVQLS